MQSVANLLSLARILERGQREARRRRERTKELQPLLSKSSLRVKLDQLVIDTCCRYPGLGGKCALIACDSPRLPNIRLLSVPRSKSNSKRHVTMEAGPSLGKRATKYKTRLREGRVEKVNKMTAQ